MMGGVKAHYDCIKAFSETDFTEDLKKFDVPTLVITVTMIRSYRSMRRAWMSAKIVKGCDPESVSRFSARDAHNQCGPDQCRPAGVIKQSKQAAA